jgi:hypothetical protein
MRARTEKKGYGLWEAYICDGRHSGATTCTIKAIGREDIDRAVWSYFENVALDWEAMVREDEERRSLQLAEIARQIGEASGELNRADERLRRVRRDYLDARLEVAQMNEFVAELRPERDAAAAALDRLRARAAELETEEVLRDAEAETRAALQAIRETLAGLVTGAADLDAARRAVTRVFESFTLHQYEPGSVIEGDLALGDWFIVPTVRADALLSPLVIGTDEHEEATIEQAQEVRRVPLSTEEKLSASRR